MTTSAVTAGLKTGRYPNTTSETSPASPHQGFFEKIKLLALNVLRYLGSFFLSWCNKKIAPQTLSSGSVEPHLAPPTSSNQLQVIRAPICPLPIKEKSTPALEETEKAADPHETALRQAMTAFHKGEPLLIDDFEARYGIKLFTAEARHVVEDGSLEKMAASKAELRTCCECKDRFWSVLLTGFGNKDSDYISMRLHGRSTHVTPVLCHDDGKEIHVLIMNSIESGFIFLQEQTNFLAQLIESRPDRTISIGRLAEARQYDIVSCHIDALVMVRDAYREIQLGRANNLFELVGVDRSQFTTLVNEEQQKQRAANKDVPYLIMEGDKSMYLGDYVYLKLAKAPMLELPSFLAKTVQRMKRFLFTHPDAWVRTKKGVLSLEAFRKKYVVSRLGDDGKDHAINTYLEHKLHQFVRRIGALQETQTPTS